ncbi:MAG: hypothetical protein CM1200mP29_14230 [Verrucomicrobiota bacterium]|nr:MAG: hypothetical protein CM1200mP29_14230 [Verrucomicrobiota bacterium]
MSDRMEILQLPRFQRNYRHRAPRACEYQQNGILRQLGQCFLKSGANFKATDQPDVTIWIVLHQVEHPLGFRNPFARFDITVRLSVLIRHLVEMFGEYRSIQNLVVLRWPRQALRPVGVVQMNVRVDDRDIGTLLVGRTTGQNTDVKTGTISFFM